MKTLLLILALAFSVSAQQTTVKPTPTPTTSIDKTEDFGFALTAEEKITLSLLDLTQNAIPNCNIEESAKTNRCEDIDKKLAKLYGLISQSPNLMRYLAARAVKSFETNKSYAKSAPQVSQIADQQNAELLRIIVMQNQRIIELLEQLAKAKGK